MDPCQMGEPIESTKFRVESNHLGVSGCSNTSFRPTQGRTSTKGKFWHFSPSDAGNLNWATGTGHGDAMKLLKVFMSWQNWYSLVCYYIDTNSEKISKRFILIRSEALYAVKTLGDMILQAFSRGSSPGGGLRNSRLFTKNGRRGSMARGFYRCFYDAFGVITNLLLMIMSIMITVLFGISDAVSSPG